MSTINVAVDGPAGSGKSTLARAAAKALGYIYVDTGAVYRALGYAVSRQGRDCGDPVQVIPLLDKITVELKYINGEQRVYADGEDVSDKIRTPEASMNASKISPIPEVRAHLLDIQKKLAAENNVIMDGRDIGTVVLPHAQVKVFLTAADTVRADRRFKELTEKGQQVDHDEILADIRQRDKNDTERETAPLKQAEDALLLDTSDLNAEQALEKLLEIIKEKTANV